MQPTTEIQEAAIRLRRVRANEPLSDVYPNEMEPNNRIHDDERILADAWIAADILFQQFAEWAKGRKCPVGPSDRFWQQYSVDGT